MHKRTEIENSDMTMRSEIFSKVSSKEQYPLGGKEQYPHPTEGNDK